MAGRIAKILEFLRASRNGAQLAGVKVNPGGGANITGQHMADAGDDSQPLAGDYGAVLGIPRSRGADGVLVGYVDIKNAGKAASGEKRIYSRDASGNVVAEVWLKNDGSVSIITPKTTITHAADGTITTTNNGGGFISMASSGVVTINGVTFDKNGNVSTSGEMTADGVDLSTHVHSDVESGLSNSGPPV
jgi:hypothetical protein